MPSNPLKRIGIFLFTVGIWWLSDHYLRPYCGPVLRDLREAFGNNSFTQHLISQSLPVDLICLLLFFLYYKLRIVPAPQFRGQARLIFGEGILWGALICIPTVILALQMGYHVGFSPNWLSMAGNLFSNTYEEFTYRFFLFSVAVYAFRNTWLALLATALLFASIHTQYPVSMQIVVGIASVCFSLAYIRSGSLCAAILAHIIADAILDSILIAPS